MSTVLVGDCRALMAEMAPESVDAIVTDPPYELGFMGKKWDASGIAYDGEVWRQALRVLKPGGHLLAFGGTRTYHRMTCAIEDAGFEIRDCIQWLYATGFPKSLNVRKSGGSRVCQCDSPAGEPVAVAGQPQPQDGGAWPACGWCGLPVVPEGLGTALKPACEPIVVARRPLIDTVAANVLAHGTGGLNIDGCRIGGAWENRSAGQGAGRETANANGAAYQKGLGGVVAAAHPAGRWPANVVLDPEAAAMLDAQSGEGPSGVAVQRNGGGQRIGSVVYGGGSAGLTRSDTGFGDFGGASRFFYVAKPSRAERDAGIGGEARPTSEVTGRDPESAGAKNPRAGMTRTARRNLHPTVKPVDLMEWLVRLVTPPGGLVLDPFTGSGSTGCAAVRQGFRFVGCELDPVYARFARLRIRLAVNAPKAAPLRATRVADDVLPGQMALFGEEEAG